MSKLSPATIALRERLAQADGPRFWRSLDELADTEEFRELVAREFPRQAAVWDDVVDRRRFLTLMGASLALAGLNGCSQKPPEKIVPYVHAPERIVPGKPLRFATALAHDGDALGLLVESHMGRPTKIEGNPEHPASQGATDAIAQASILSLYDPDRAQTVTHLGEISTWDAFLLALRTELDVQRQRQGSGLRLLTETVTSPTLGRQIRQVLEAFPAARWHQYDPLSPYQAAAGARQALGEDVGVVYRFREAKVVVSLDADFLTQGPGHVRYAGDFMQRRNASGDPAEISRLYVIESSFSGTGAAADHRLALRPGAIGGFARALAAELGVEVRSPADVTEEVQRFVKAVAEDLQGRLGQSLVVVGRGQDASVHALAHAINARLENVGKTLIYSQPVEIEPEDQFASLEQLADDLAAKKVELLMIVGGNPVYNAPADFEFAKRMRACPMVVHLSLYDDETSELSHWHLPQSHYLESWSDTLAFDGTASIVQPLIAPLYGGTSPHELLAALTEKVIPPPYDLVRGTWQEIHGEESFETFWRQSVHDGVVADTAFETKSVELQAAIDFGPAAAIMPKADELELVFRPDTSVWDGRFANNGWLQEAPRPFSTLTWDNAALLSPATAASLGVKSGDVVTLELDGRSVEAPVLVSPGHAAGAVTVQLGYGRTRGGRVASGVGFNAYMLRTAKSPWVAFGVKVKPTGRTHLLATTQTHFNIEGRRHLRTSTLAELAHHRTRPSEHHTEHVHGEHEPTMLNDFEYPGYAWGMVVDLTKCVGCSACVVACQAENNIPVVGKEGVSRGREMHWLRIDQYYLGPPDEPEVYSQPMLCQHCEHAPCEVVCPVAATTHSPEGLNEMTYNRCIGTRYCSNNCPYKVRRFNFLEYNSPTPPVLELLHNPNVTVRSRGVMEKCTFCVQRINASRIEAEERTAETGEVHRIQDGDVVTACQAACPSRAIVFGDINDPKSRVAEQKKDPRNYGVLEELGTRPRTTYLTAVKNKNEQLEKKDG